MKALTKYLAGAATVAALTLSAASPAQAQSWDRHRDRDGIDVGDVVTGVALLGGIAAVISAIDGGGDRYGYGRPGYRYGYGNDRYGYGNDRYGYGNDRYGYGNGRYGYGSAQRRERLPARRSGSAATSRSPIRPKQQRLPSSRQDRRRDYDGRGWNRRYDVIARITCFARNGRIYDFRV